MSAPQPVAYDEYLESKLRVVVECLVEALLTTKPNDVEGFCLKWLEQWHKDHDPDHEMVEQLRAERDVARGIRDGLLEQLKEREAARPSSAASSGGACSSTSPTSRKRESASLSPTAFEAPITAAEEAREQAKIDRMKQKDRRPGVSAEAVSEERLRQWKKPFFEKPPEARERLKQNIDRSEKLQVLFGHLTDAHLYSVIDAMFPREAHAGENIITQGEEGDNFYIVDEGSLDVFVQRGDAPAGKVLQYGPGDMFGELALMYNAKRAATVTATTDVKLWALDRESFQIMLITAENTKISQYEEFLSKVPVLQHLTKLELSQLSDLLEPQCYDGSEDIVKQGDEANYFYLLEDGEAKAYVSGEAGEVEVKHYTTPGEYFGEIALLTNAVRRATVRAVGEGCAVLSVARKDFELVLGPIRNILEAHIDEYPAYADFLKRGSASQ